MTKRWHKYHVLELDNMGVERVDGAVVRLFGGQLNSASSREVRDRNIEEII